MKNRYSSPARGDCCNSYMHSQFPPGRGCCGGPHDYTCAADYGCYMPKMKCKASKECVKTYKTYYRLYKISTYRLYKVCSRCGAEFDYYALRGMCPHC